MTSPFLKDCCIRVLGGTHASLLVGVIVNRDLSQAPRTPDSTEGENAPWQTWAHVLAKPLVASAAFLLGFSQAHIALLHVMVFLTVPSLVASSAVPPLPYATTAALYEKSLMLFLASNAALHV